jgi:hypothetical protein
MTTNVLERSLQSTVANSSNAVDETIITSTPIDAVITWVNHNDPAWQNQRTAWQTKVSNIAPDAIHNRRFESNGEIVVALKSILKFANWVNQVFLVVATQSQIDYAPDALRQLLQIEAGRIRVVKHSEIIDKGDLPTFNSCAIEVNIHRIPGLADFFIKFDDDMMLGRSTAKSDFLAVIDGVAAIKVSLSSSAKDDLAAFAKRSTLWERRVAQNFTRLELYRRSLVPNVEWASAKHRRIITHGPTILSKAILRDVVDGIFKEAAKVTLNNRFRAVGDLQAASWMAQHVALLKKCAVAEWDTPETFTMVAVAKWNKSVTSELASLVHNPPRTFCVNNAATSDNEKATTDTFRNFLHDFEE